jgi:hypothetical protein
LRALVLKPALCWCSIAVSDIEPKSLNPCVLFVEKQRVIGNYAFDRGPRPARRAVERGSLTLGPYIDILEQSRGHAGRSMAHDIPTFCALATRQMRVVEMDGQAPDGGKLVEGVCQIAHRVLIYGCPPDAGRVDDGVYAEALAHHAGSDGVEGLGAVLWSEAVVPY